MMVMATLFPSFRRRPESSHKWNHSSIAKATSGYPLRGNIFNALDSGLRRNDTPQDLQRAQRGFTLIELLVALVILVLLSMAGIRLLWQETISATPNPGFRRIEVTVAQPEFQSA